MALGGARALTLDAVSTRADMVTGGDALVELRDLGNTVIVVEHDEETIRSADWVLDLGPGAGVHGGRIVGQGKPEDLSDFPESLTARYLAGEEEIPTPSTRLPQIS